MGVVSMRMIGAAVVALVLAAGAYAVPATAAPGDDGARAADVAGSAIALNLTSAEAATRADVQELAEQSGEVLIGNPEVAAFWLEDPPSTALVVATRLGSKLRITDLGLPPGLAKNARLVAVKHSEADLAATATAVGRAAQGRGRPVTVHVDVRSQVVEVTAADAASAAEVAADVQANPVPAADAVTVTVDDLAHPAAATIYAGMAGSGCTTGFTVVRTSDSKRGISTAAHCSNGQNIAGVSIPFVAEWWQYSSDIQWNSAGSTVAVFRNRARDDAYDATPYYRSITGTLSRTSLVIGGTYCKYGNVTSYDCGTLKSRTEYASWVTNSTATFLAIDHASICSGGDSGGPAYTSSNAIGLISGCTSDHARVIVMSMDGFAQTNIKVATT